MMKHWFAAAFAAAALLTGSALSASAAEAEIYFDSNPGMPSLTADEADQYEAVLQDVADAIDMDAYLYFCDMRMEDGEYVFYTDDNYEEPIYDGRDAVYCYISTTDETADIIFNTGGAAGMYFLSSDRMVPFKRSIHQKMYDSEPMNFETVIILFSTHLWQCFTEGPIKDLCIYDDVNDVYYYEENGELITSEEEPDFSAEKNESDEGDEVEKGMPYAEYPGTALIYDEANHLREDEYEQCLEMLQDAADRTGMNVGLVLGGEFRSEYTIESLADASYDSMFGSGTDGILYYMDLSGASSPYDYISTCGLGQFYYTNSDRHDRINEIFDHVFPYLTPAGSEDVPLAVEAFAEDVVYYYEKGIPKNYYVYDDVYQSYMYVEDGAIVYSPTLPLSQIDPAEFLEEILILGFVGIAAGFIVALIVYLCVRHHYKFKVSLSPTAYVNRKNLVFHRRYDNFIRTYTTRTRIDSGGGGGGGRGGGGRSSGGHGGGGRHR